MKFVSPPVRLSLRPARRGGRRPIGSAARALRVSTAEQAEKELTLTAQRRSAEEFAARHDAAIDQHDIVPGASGTDTHRTVFNELLDAALRPGGTTAVIVVRHTSRFTRDATHASTPPPWFLRSDNGTRR